VRVRLSVRDSRHGLRDVQITAPDGTRLADVLSPLAGESATGILPPTVWSGSTRLERTAPLGTNGLRNGATLRLADAHVPDSPAGSPLQIAVIGGPNSGMALPLTTGEIVVGRAATCHLPVLDPDVSRRHLTLSVTASGVTVRDLGSTNGTRIEGNPVCSSGSEAAVGDAIQLGNSTLTVTCAQQDAAALTPATDGTLIVNRPPATPAKVSEEITYPDEPENGGTPRIPWLAALLPAVLAVFLAAAFHAAQYLAFALLSPAMLLGSAAGDRWRWRRGHRRASVDLARRQALADRQRADLLITETAARRRSHPDAASVLRTATVPDCRVWERRTDQAEFGTVRFGLANQQSRLAVTQGGLRSPAGMVRCVPFTADLRAGPVGVLGPLHSARASARWLVGQLAVAHTPADLSFVLLITAASECAWTWTRWLPHRRAVASSPEEHVATTAALRSLVEARLADPGRQTAAWSGSWTILVVDPSGDLADVPGLVGLLAAGRQIGISGICVDDRRRRLLASCSTVVTVDGDVGAHLAAARPSGSVVENFSIDQVTTEWAERVARGLAPLVDAGTDPAATIPATCLLFDLLGLNRGELASTLIDHWRTRTGRPRTAIGLGAQGVVELDLIRDGPHVLVAGTTGSGKSELLQSLVAGLSVANAPDEIAFVLVDYKGGATFSDCGRLPHTVGVVTDLDAHLTRRALRSLDAELRRREVLFAELGARDLDQYRMTAPVDRGSLHRLILIVDEFAALAEELPDFLNGLIDIAQRGRSLGIHLILATQRPGGVISPAIRANTTLRIALRVTDPSESVDVVGSAAAAAIDRQRPGRAYVRVG
jgi:DNA segregation ATPase FtsK/SpoIIIE, S-DNA-T family